MQCYSTVLVAFSQAITCIMCRIPKPQMDLEIRLYEYYLYKTSEVPQQRMDIAIPSLAYVKHRPGSCGSKFRICSEFDVLHTVPNLAYDTNYGHFLYCAWAWYLYYILHWTHDRCMHTMSSPWMWCACVF